MQQDRDRLAIGSRRAAQAERHVRPKPRRPARRGCHQSGALSETGAGIAGALAKGAGTLAEAGGLMVGSVLWRPEGDGFYLGRLAV
jgi:hypothetical protein